MADTEFQRTSTEDLMDRDCPTCKHYLAEEEEGLCCKGVRWGTHSLSATSAKTMREDHWWGHQACGKDAKFWEPAHE